MYETRLFKNVISFKSLNIMLLGLNVIEVW